MVLDAQLDMRGRKQKPRRRMSFDGKRVSKEVLLLKQRVNRKGKRSSASLLRSASSVRSEERGKKSSLLPLLRAKFAIPAALVRKAGSGKSSFIAIALSSTLILGLLAYNALLTISAEETKIALPEESSSRVHLLHYIAPESEARGSGEVGGLEMRVVDTVNTFSYTVERGDTLSEIASRHDLDVGTLISFNDIDDVRRVMAGTELTIPNVDGVPYTVRKGDTLERIAGRYNIRLESILDANDLQSAIIQPGEVLFIPGGEISEYEYKKAMGTLFIYPSAGRLTSGYGYRQDPFTGIRRMHYGIDLAEAIGTNIQATMAGTVASIGNQPRGYGKYVVLQHRHGFQSLYGHLSTIEVRRGQYIGQGQKIGEMGNSGRSTGPHLHFSLYKNNVPVNPLGGYLYQ